jgi:hypothetical protein
MGLQKLKQQAPPCALALPVKSAKPVPAINTARTNSLRKIREKSCFIFFLLFKVLSKISAAGSADEVRTIRVQIGDALRESFIRIVGMAVVRQAICPYYVADAAAVVGGAFGTGFGAVAKADKNQSAGHNGKDHHFSKNIRSDKSFHISLLFWF